MGMDYSFHKMIGDVSAVSPTAINAEDFHKELSGARKAMSFNTATNTQKALVQAFEKMSNMVEHHDKMKVKWEKSEDNYHMALLSYDEMKLELEEKCDRVQKETILECLSKMGSIIDDLRKQIEYLQYSREYTKELGKK